MSLSQIILGTDAEGVYRRLRSHRRLKLTGIGVFIGCFFVGYFLLLRFPIRAVSVMPITALDREIPFHPWALFVYLSLWFYISLAPMLMTERSELWTYCASALATALIGFALFLVWPSAVPRPDIDWTRYPGFGFLKELDASGNSCPSLHVAFAVLTAIFLDQALVEMGSGSLRRILSMCWCLAIIYSTMAVKQHVAVDVYAGVLLALVTAGAGAFVFRPRRAAVRA